MRLTRSSLLCCLALVVWLCQVVPSVSAYDIVDVQHGGSLEGRVTLSGAVPDPKAFNLITFPDPTYCGRISNGKGWRLLRDFIVNAESGLKNAVVLLEGVESGKPFDLSVPLIEARDCMFGPWMTIVRNGHAVEVVNMDPVMHDIQGYETSPEAGARVLFNTPLILNQQHQRGNMHAIHNHAPGKSLVGPVYLNKGRRTFYMQCGFHAYMESWAMAVNNMYIVHREADIPPEQLISRPNAVVYSSITPSASVYQVPHHSIANETSRKQQDKGHKNMY